jgi:hypothetical protein
VVSGGWATFSGRRALVGGLLGLLCAAPIPRPLHATTGAEEEWNRAIEAARADRAASDPRGTYFGAFVKRLAQVQGPALRACRARHPEGASTSFQAVARLSKDGTIEQLLIKPTSEFHACVRAKIKVSAFPKPPKAPYWLFWGTAESPGRDP